jgi:hypothetical protein
LHVTLQHVAGGEGVQCGWSVPKSAKGKALHALVKVSSGGLSTSHSYSFRVR